MNTAIKSVMAATLMALSMGVALADDDTSAGPATVVVSSTPVHYPDGVNPDMGAAGDQGGP
jgi:hypothetical protein